MNWGKGITLVIILFIITMLGMVYVASKQTNEMVEANYYDKELKYQNLIDASKNLNTVTSDSILVQMNDKIEINIPQTLIANFSNGILELLSNDTGKKDVNFNFTPDQNGKYAVAKSNISSGYYKAKIKWESNAKVYYREQNIIIK
ncbi:MAG: FixH family protein [Saprospiraceae bacterium]|jgi:hypothetical protein|nr:FixH family protein [Saprospiraceae bacterium]